jgi:aminoglycoside phosphotransferase (APT) family kinase protein
MTDELPGLDLEVFRRWYDGQRPGEIAGDLSGELIAGGKSNLTYDVTDGSSHWIVRRPPLGHVQATAHDMGREFTAMSALAATAVPVPAMYAHCQDPDVLGAPFYVMEKVDGIAIRRASELEERGTARTALITERLVEVLAQLHRVDVDLVGLSEFGRPAGFLERQVRRWGQQLEGSKTQERPAAEELHRRLTDAAPAVGGDPSALGIVHGDYRLDNCLVGDDDRIHAVVDWEMATLGDTRTDLALMMVYETLGRSDAGELVSDVAQAQGYPDNAGQLAAYTAASGRKPGDMGFHMALAYFKLAVILEGIHYRYLKGQTVGEGFDRIGEGFDLIIAAGLAELDR